jgi:uncharacterized protein YjbJ (UPF0337 family)
MNKDELDGKADALEGRVKQGVGDPTDNDRLRDEGVVDDQGVVGTLAMAPSSRAKKTTSDDADRIERLHRVLKRLEQVCGQAEDLFQMARELRSGGPLDALRAALLAS